MHDDQHPHSPAYLLGSHCYVSGTHSVDERGAAIVGGRPTLDGAVARLADHVMAVAMDLSAAVKLTYLVTDVSLREEAMRQLSGSFTVPGPTRSFVDIAALPYGATVEPVAVAAVQGAHR